MPFGRRGPPALQRPILHARGGLPGGPPGPSPTRKASLVVAAAAVGAMSTAAFSAFESKLNCQPDPSGQNHCAAGSSGHGGGGGWWHSGSSGSSGGGWSSGGHATAFGGFGGTGAAHGGGGE